MNTCQHIDQEGRGTPELQDSEYRPHNSALSPHQPMVAPVPESAPANHRKGHMTRSCLKDLGTSPESSGPSAQEYTTAGCVPLLYGHSGDLFLKQLILLANNSKDGSEREPPSRTPARHLSTGLQGLTWTLVSTACRAEPQSTF